MSDIRKWMKIMESVPATLADQAPKAVVIKKDATVMVSPSIGGGTARYIQSTPQGAMVEIKGVIKELPHGDFSLPTRDYEDPFTSGNSWEHVNADPETVGTMNDKPEFTSGDMVKVADVYGSVIGPGFGVLLLTVQMAKIALLALTVKKLLFLRQT